MSIPSAFCWTRFGTEAGEPIEAIFERKERERQLNGGVFLWGIGNSIRPSILALVAQESRPSVLFSPMLSKPSVRDACPTDTVLWTSAVGLNGVACDLPPASVVTSSLRQHRPRTHHYALVCSSDEPIGPQSPAPTLNLHDLRNWSNGTNIGASQVTCIVQHEASGRSSGPRYEVALTATLVAPYFVRLGDPRLIPQDLRICTRDPQTVESELLKLRNQGEPDRQLTLV